MEDDRVALSVQAGGHPAIGAMDDVAAERTPFDLRSAMSASRSSTSKAIVPPAAALGSSGIKLVSATQPPPGRSYSIHHWSPLFPSQAGREPEGLFVELARPR